MDVLAANLLSMKLGHGEVVPLFAQTDSPATRLRQAMQAFLDATVGDSVRFQDLDSIDEEPFLRFRAACHATEAADGQPKVSQWSAVTVSKVLHRLRPSLAPIMDSRVTAFYSAKGKQHPVFYKALLHDLGANRDWLQGVAEGRSTADHRELTLLRTADIVIWDHLYSGCQA